MRQRWGTPGDRCFLVLCFFLFHINDLQTSAHMAKCVDDSTLWSVISTSENRQLQQSAQEADIHGQMILNLMSLNCDKTGRLRGWTCESGETLGCDTQYITTSNGRDIPPCMQQGIVLALPPEDAETARCGSQGHCCHLRGPNMLHFGVCMPSMAYWSKQPSRATN